jgi:cephalosporin-C deacetylase-like acetyl esterase
MIMPYRKVLRLASALLSAGSALLAQATLTPASERLRLFQAYLARRGAEITTAQAAVLQDAGAWKQKRAEARRQLLNMLGLDPLPERTPLHARITGQFRRERYRVEKIVLQSMPGLYVTGNLYVPNEAGRKPAVLYLCGHAPGPWGAKAQYQHHGIRLANHGYVAFLIDSIEFGEIPGIHHGLHDLNMWNWLSLGYTPAGPEVWNAIRAMDYLSTRPEVDSARVALTGISGGGAITWYAAAVDDRFQAASPVCSTWSVGSQVAEKSVVENCDCIYFPNTYGLDLSAVGALIAPRPLKLLSARRDEMFPPSGYNEVARLLRGLYEGNGAADKFAEYDHDAPHQDIPAFRKEADKWINRWLKSDATPFEEGEIKREEGAQLAVLDGTPADAVNDHIQDTFIRRAKLRVWKTRAEWKQRRTELQAALKDKVFRALPNAQVPFDAVRVRETGWTDRYAEAWNVEFTSEPGVRITGQLFLPRDTRLRDKALVYIKGADDLVDAVDYDLILPALGKQVVLTLRPRAVDYPLDLEGMATVKRTAALLGATLESMQVSDILRAVEYLTSGEGLTPSSIAVFGRKQMGALGIYAALLEPRITRVIVDDPPSSHWQGPALLNVLRLTDLPETAAMVAPREIVSLTPLPPSWRYTSHIYALYGKPMAIREVHGMTQATRVP